MSTIAIDPQLTLLNVPGFAGAGTYSQARGRCSLTGTALTIQDCSLIGTVPACSSTGTCSCLLTGGVFAWHLATEKGTTTAPRRSAPCSALAPCLQEQPVCDLPNTAIEIVLMSTGRSDTHDHQITQGLQHLGRLQFCASFPGASGAPSAPYSFQIKTSYICKYAQISLTQRHAVKTIGAHTTPCSHTHSTIHTKSQRNLRLHA